MNSILSNTQIEYVLFHLDLTFELSQEIRERFCFTKNKTDFENSEGIVFPLSESALVLEQILTINNIPVLFPYGNSKEMFRIEGKALLFQHDLLKSVFYLLSGYQELSRETLDSFGRFPYAESIQKKLGFIHKPFVNYYFEILAGGIEKYCKINGIEFIKRVPFNNFCFFLTHDVDRVDTYTLNEVIYRFKQAFGLSKPLFSPGKSFRVAFKFLINYLNIFNRRNPVWDFPFLRDQENKHGFRSAFYFLPKDVRHQDAYYSFKERRIRELMKCIDHEGCEIGLHGSVKSSESEQSMAWNFKLLQEASPQTVQGIRQHRLLFNIKKTPAIFQKTGFLYDTSLSFAEHEGFRNSFCLPFRLYDHENDHMLDTWEIPLTVMDATLFYYHGYSPEKAMDAVRILLKEVRRFNGVFTLLWHNGFFDEDLYPGITQFYLNLLDMISREEPENLLGWEIVERVNR